MKRNFFIFASFSKAGSGCVGCGCVIWLIRKCTMSGNHHFIEKVFVLLALHQHKGMGGSPSGDAVTLNSSFSI